MSTPTPAASSSSSGTRDDFRPLTEAAKLINSQLKQDENDAHDLFHQVRLAVDIRPPTWYRHLHLHRCTQWPSGLDPNDYAHLSSLRLESSTLPELPSLEEWPRLRTLALHNVDLSSYDWLEKLKKLKLLLMN